MKNNSSRRILALVGWRYLTHHPWQSILMVAGIALGVAVVVAINLANVSASRAFDISTESLTGRATHQIDGGPQGLAENIYTQLRRSGIPLLSAPVISDFVVSPQLGSQPLELLGVDPFAEAPFRTYLGSSDTVRGNGASPPQADPGSFSAFLTQPGAILLSQDLAQRFHLAPCPSGKVDAQASEPGCRIEIESGGHPSLAFIAGLIQPGDTNTPEGRLLRRSLEGMVLADIATAQEITGKLGRLDHIDLIVPEGDLANQAQVRSLLPPGVELRLKTERSGTLEEMTAAFRLNLTALSLLALLVGMFLIYNTMTFSVVQRRELFGTLRCLGVTRREVFALVVGEAALVGILGAVLGSLLGVLLGQGAVRLVTQTINDLFFVLTVRGVQAPLSSLLVGSALGITATILSAAPPAWEAASVPPRLALSRSNLETKTGSYIRLASLSGLALFLAGLALLVQPFHSLGLSFAGTFAMVVGFALLTPLCTRGLMHIASPFAGWLWGSLGRMAPRDVVNSLSRTSIAVMALMVAVSVTIGVSLMISSFRYTVQVWLAETLRGDVYISTPGLNANQASGTVDPQVVEIARRTPGVNRVEVLRAVPIDSPSGPVQVAASSNHEIGDERLFKSLAIPKTQVWNALLEGSVLVSEPLANRLELPAQGASLELETPAGLRRFPVVGVYYDYSSSQGNLLMALPFYQQTWGDLGLTAVQLRLAPGYDPDELARSLQGKLQGSLPVGQRLVVRSNRNLRSDVLEVFDRTFAITAALQVLAMLVAFIGVLSALLSLELERQHELGILRAVGLTIRQVWGLILLETGLMGLVAGLLAIPAGFMLALILVYIINLRSFGWTLQLQISPQPFLVALLISMTAALLAGIYPAWRIGGMRAAEALRNE